MQLAAKYVTNRLKATTGSRRAFGNSRDLQSGIPFAMPCQVSDICKRDFGWHIDMNTGRQREGSHCCSPCGYYSSVRASGCDPHYLAIPISIGANATGGSDLNPYNGTLSLVMSARPQDAPNRYQ